MIQMVMNKRKRAFTLLEITLCIALLALLSGILVWNMKKMLDTHAFHQSIDQILTEMNKAQLLALSYNTDLEVRLFKEEGSYQFQITSDGPVKLLKTSKVIKLKKVVECLFNKKMIENIRLHVYSNGRIEPLGLLTFYHETEETNEEREGVALDFRTPLLIKKIAN